VEKIVDHNALVDSWYGVISFRNFLA